MFSRIQITELVLLSLLFCMGVSCTDIAELDMAWESSLFMVSPDDFSTILTFPAMVNPRCFMICPGTIYVASTEGTVYVLDAESGEITGEYKVGPASASGYCRMVYSPSEGSAYLIGAMGSVLEITIPECQVIDEIKVCSTPFDLEITDGAPGYLWIADKMTNTIIQIRLSNNQKCNVVRYYDESIIQCMESIEGIDTLIVGTSMFAYRIEIINNITLHNSCINPAGSYSSLAAIPNTSSFIAVKDNKVGQLFPFGMPVYPPDPVYIYAEYIPGILHMTAPGNDNIHMFVLSYLGEGITRFTSYNYIGGIGIDNTAEFEGFPLDFHVSGNGNLYVLTY